MEDGLLGDLGCLSLNRGMAAALSMEDLVDKFKAGGEAYRIVTLCQPHI